MSDARIVRVCGTLAEARPLPGASLYELLHLGARGLLGEVVRVEGETATAQVFEDTAGLALGEPVEATGSVLTAQLGPGLLGSVLDGLGRPLRALAEHQGTFLAPGSVPTLDTQRRWEFAAQRRVGERVVAGDVLGTVEERPGIVHSVMLPPMCEGTIARIDGGEYSVDQPLGALEDGTLLTLAQRWPVRTPRPSAAVLASDRPFVTGQRVFDLLFPVAEGGAVSLPGGFGTGKTVIEQSLARLAQADIVVFVGCGERGNEMAEVLEEFPDLVDPISGRSVMDRSVLVVNTSNMPVAAREASVYLGLTIGEYYRDMGHRVAVLVDSLSRWAEALRETGSRLQEMPGEEGYPPYLANRLGKHYERAGRVRCGGSPDRTGALTLVSAVSPPGGDFSEPVTQASLRVAGALWALDASLAHQRQFPAVDWEASYSFYADRTAGWFSEHAGAAWAKVRRATLELLQRERELREVAGLVGAEALEEVDRLVLEVARIVREVVIGQSAYEPYDAFSPVTKTLALASLTQELHRAASDALESGRTLAALDLAGARRAIAAVRVADPESFERCVDEARAGIDALARGAPQKDESP